MSVVDLQDVVMLNGFGTVVNALGKRVKPYLPQICGTILWRLNNKSAKVRQQAADLISRIAVVMKTCQEVSHQNVCLIRDICINGIGQLLHSPLYFPKYPKIRDMYTNEIGYISYVYFPKYHRSSISFKNNVQSRWNILILIKLFITSCL